MKLKKSEFLVLRAFAESDDIYSQRHIASLTGLSIGSVNASLKGLRENELIYGSSITESGLQALEPYKVDNAIILAAGLSSRFAPISYEKPKGVLSVRGEILVERLIKQLREVGIQEIVLVVGYKKEQFFYLHHELGVEIVVNEEYDSRNNNSSMMAAKDYLKNSYVCSSDDYYIDNPYALYEWRPYYFAHFAEGETEEWCISEDRNGHIKSVEIGGRDAWFMIGHAYFDRDFSNRFKQILLDEYNHPTMAPKLWEEVFLDHAKELKMVVKKVDPPICFEFDTLDDVREFDPMFLENVDSGAFDNIAKTLNCQISDIHDVYPLKQGLTNLSCHFSTPNGEYVYRHPGVGTEQLIDRNAEAVALKTARELGLDDTFVFEDPESGWKISRFIVGARNVDPRNADEMRRAMEMCRSLHESEAVVDRSFDFFEEGKRYESLLEEKGPIDVPGYYEMSKAAKRLREYAAADDTFECLCHNDFFYMNFLIDGQDKMSLIDWEYAGMSDYANDFGTCVVCCEMSFEEAMRALHAYFGRTPTFEEIRHNMAFVALAGWCWYVWSLVKEAEGDSVGNWLYIYYSYAEKYMNEVISWYEVGRSAVREDFACAMV